MGKKRKWFSLTIEPPKPPEVWVVGESVELYWRYGENSSLSVLLASKDALSIVEQIQQKSGPE